LMTRSMLSDGTLEAFALAMTSRSFPLLAGSGPPSLTATAISRPILVKTLARWLSVFSFFLLILFHLECPDIFSTSSLSVRFFGSNLPFKFYHLPPFLARH